MGFTDPVYSRQETEGMSEQDLKKLRAAIHNALNTDPEIRRLLKEKTSSLYNQLNKKTGS